MWSALAVVLLLGVSRGATAGSITFIEIDRYFSPGNTGTAMIDPETPSAADVSLNFTTPDTLLIHLGVDGAGEYLIHTNGVTGGIANNTHLPWTSLIWEVAGPPGTVPDTIGFDDPQYFVNGVINNPRCLANGEIEPGYIVLDQGTVPVARSTTSTWDSLRPRPEGSRWPTRPTYFRLSPSLRAW